MNSQKSIKNLHHKSAIVSKSAPKLSAKKTH